MCPDNLRPCVVTGYINDGIFVSCSASYAKRYGIDVTGYEAKFHRWGYAYDEFESGPGNYTIGVIEFANGQVYVVNADNIRFTDV